MTEEMEITHIHSSIFVTDKKKHIQYEIRLYSTKNVVYICNNCNKNINKKKEHLHIKKTTTHQKNKYGLWLLHHELLKNVYICSCCINDLEARKKQPKALLAFLKLKELL